MISRQADCFLLLILFIISAAAPAAAEMITGTVVSVDREQKVFLLRTDTRQEIEVQANRLPKRLISGRQIRVWGDYTVAHKKFTATDIRGAGKNRHHDQTGVRARIGNGKYCLKPGDTNSRRDCSHHGKKDYRRKVENAEPDDVKTP